MKCTYESKNYILDVAIRTEDENTIIELLQRFLAAKEVPKRIYLKRLGEAKYLPEPILAELT